MHHMARAFRSSLTVPISILSVGIVVLILALSQPVQAQDGTDVTPVTEQPAATEVVTEAPATEAVVTAVSTETPTQAPTEALPTTEVPATEAVVTTTPSEATVEATSEAPVEVTSATPVVAAPVFNFTHGTQFDSTAGTALMMQVMLTHQTQTVSVTVSAGQGIATVTTGAPAEAIAPFNTLVSITYTAATSFSGLDTLIVSATDSLNQTTSVPLTLNVLAPVAPTTVPTAAAPATKELLITYNPSSSEAAIQAMLTGLQAVEVSRIPQIGAMRVLVPDTQALPTTAMATLQSTNTATLAGVTSVETNGSYQLFAYTPNDPGFASQWGLKPGPIGISAEYAWSIATTRGLGVTIAVIDGGVDLQHPDLVYQLVPGWDFVKDDSSPDNFDINNPLDPNDDAYDNGHGTHVAGIIAARTGNAVGTAGVAFNAKIMPLRACDVVGDCNMYYVAGAIVYAVDKGAKVINMSFGSKDPSSTVEAAINYALSKNVVVVAASGNIGTGPAGKEIVDGDLVYPASYPGVINVAAYDNTGTRTALSNSNNTVDISAPGAGIYSLKSIELGSYGTMNGTSMASAYVSGVAALIVGSKVATTPATVLDALTCGAADAGPAGYDNQYGYGRLQADVSLTWNSNSKGCKITLPNDSIQTPTVMTAAPFTSILPIHSRSVTTHLSDPSPICDVFTPVQTLWYTFKPTVSGYYQLSTLGSSYNTALAVYRGGVGQLSMVGCSTISQTVFSLQAAQTYYIVVGTAGTAVDDQLLQLRLNAALPTNNLLYQENALNIAYSGMWTRGAVLGSSGGYTQQTTDPSAAAAFSFRGMKFDYIRTMGPTQGQVLIYINNDPTPIIVDNRGAVLKGNQIKSVTVPNATSGQWNTVRIVRDTSVPGSIDLDAIKTYDFDNVTLLAPIATKVDDRALNLLYAAGTTHSWTPAKVATTVAYGGTLMGTDDPTAKVTFRISGNALTIFRMTGAGMAPLQVVIDNGAPIIISSASPTDVVRPYTIDGLVAMPHVVEIRKSGAIDDGLIIQLDAVQGQTLLNLAAPNTYDERSPYVAYRGVWADTTVAGATALTTRTLAAGTEVSFQFMGNDLCIGYRQSSGLLDVSIDGVLMGTIPTGGGNAFVKWCLEANANKLVADSTHYARLVVPAGNTFTLDSIRPQRYNTLTPARGLVPEADLSFRYSALIDWVTRPSKSIGGFVPQGGYIRTTSTDNTTVSFYMNGSGFILYTGVGPDGGCWEVFIDGVLYHPEPGLNSINLLDGYRYRPLGYGIVGLTPGIHKVTLRADTNLDSIGQDGDGFNAYFDGVRVLP